MAYFGYYAMFGQRGWTNLSKIEQQVKILEVQLAELSDQRQSLEHRVKRLRPDSLDRDLLEERVRATLNLSSPHDTVIYFH
jgi:cell division protein FtsB